MLPSGILHGEATRHFSAIEGWKHLQDTIAQDFPAGDPLTCLVPCLQGIDPDDAFSSVPYEKGHTLLWWARFVMLLYFIVLLCCD